MHSVPLLSRYFRSILAEKLSITVNTDEFIWSHQTPGLIVLYVWFSNDRTLNWDIILGQKQLLSRAIREISKHTENERQTVKRQLPESLIVRADPEKGWEKWVQHKKWTWHYYKKSSHHTEPGQNKMGFFEHFLQYYFIIELSQCRVFGLYPILYVKKSFSVLIVFCQVQL